MRWYLELGIAVAIVAYIMITYWALKATGGADLDIFFG